MRTYKVMRAHACVTTITCKQECVMKCYDSMQHHDVMTIKYLQHNNSHCQQH